MYMLFKKFAGKTKRGFLVCVYTYTMIQTWLCDLSTCKLTKARAKTIGYWQVGYDVNSSAVVFKLFVYQYLWSEIAVLLQVSHYS